MLTFPSNDFFSIFDLGLSNPYIETETSKRTPGAVGRPFGNTTVRVVEPHDDASDKDHVLIESTNDKDTFYKNAGEGGIFGELQIKGDMVFKYYHEKPEQTKETFSDDGWFKTGLIIILIILLIFLKA